VSWALVSKNSGSALGWHPHGYRFLVRGLYAWLTELPPREDAFAAMITKSNVSPELAGKSELKDAKCF
jgi:hypothetical protein